MATYHLNVKFGGKGQAGNHADYIERKGEYEKRKDLEYSEHGNMPGWARDNPSHFWQAADQFERANGSTYREIEIALPRELTPDQRIELVQDFVRQVAGERHAYSFAIHNPKASIDGGEQPHAHIMMSQRINDGMERSPEQYFRRYNAKNPVRGGAKKDSGNLTPTQQKEQLRTLRASWSALQNEHLARHGHRVRVDHRSLEERGIKRTPERHFGFAASSRLDHAQRREILQNRAQPLEHFLEKAHSVRHQIDAQVQQKELVKTLLQDVARERGHALTARINKTGEVEFERAPTRTRSNTRGHGMGIRDNSRGYDYER
ncbi:MobA/MobL family protein [Escherichia coli]